MNSEKHSTRAVASVIATIPLLLLLLLLWLLLLSSFFLKYVCNNRRDAPISVHGNAARARLQHWALTGGEQARLVSVRELQWGPPYPTATQGVRVALASRVRAPVAPLWILPEKIPMPREERSKRKNSNLISSEYPSSRGYSACHRLGLRFFLLFRSFYPVI